MSTLLAPLAALYGGAVGSMGALADAALLAPMAAALEPHRLTTYLEELAMVAHGWYHHCHVLGEAPAVERARLALARATQLVLANGLALLGLTAPDRM